MTFASGGQRLLTLTRTKDEDSQQWYPPVWCWEVDSGQRIYIYKLTAAEDTPPPNDLITFKFATNGNWILAHDRNALYAWRLVDHARPSPYHANRSSYDGGSHSYTTKGHRFPVGDGLKVDHKSVIASSQGRKHFPNCLVACSCMTGDVVVWEVSHSSGGPICIKLEKDPQDYKVVGINFSADEKLVIVAYSHNGREKTKISLWNIEDRQKVNHLAQLDFDESIKRLALASNHIVCAMSKTIKLYTFTVNQPEFLSAPSPSGHVTDDSIQFLACYPDGKKIIVVDHIPRLLTCTMNNKLDNPWQIRSQQLYAGSIDASLPLVRFARGGGAAHPVVEVLEPKNLTLELEYRGIPPSTMSGSAGPSEVSKGVFPTNVQANWVHHTKHCLSSTTIYNHDDEESTNVVPTLSKSANTGGWSGRLSGSPSVSAAAISSDGTTFAAIVDVTPAGSMNDLSQASQNQSYQIHVWKGDSVKHLCELDSDWLRDQVYQPAFNLAFSPSGKRLAVSNRVKARVFDVTGGAVHCTELQSKAKAQMEILCMAIAPSDTRCAVGFIHGIGIWDITGNNAMKHPIGDIIRCGGDVSPNGVSSVAYSFDGQLLASRSFDGVVRVWDVSAASEKTYTSVYPTLIFSNNPAHALASPRKLLGYPHFPGQEQEQEHEQDLESDEESQTVVEGKLTPMPYEHVDDSDSKTEILSPKALKKAMDEKDFSIAEHVPEIYNGPEMVNAPLDREMANITVKTADIDIADPSQEPGLPQCSLIEEIFMTTDGWIIAVVGDEERRLLWVPEEYRKTIPQPRELWRSTGGRVNIDLSKFVHGEGWEECYRDISEDAEPDVEQEMSIGGRWVGMLQVMLHFLFGVLFYRRTHMLS